MATKKDINSSQEILDQLLKSYSEETMMRLIHNSKSIYLVIGTILHKSLEVGFQVNKWARFDLYCRLNFTGRDHAGLKVHLQLGWVLFEFNLTDSRHWNYLEDRWHTADDIRETYDSAR